jgi:hypothetical protein
MGQTESLNAAFDAVGPGEPDSSPPVQPAEHNPADVFKDLAALRKASLITVKRRVVLPAIKVIDKPSPSLYFRVNPDPEMQLDCTLVVDEEGARKKFYFITPSMRSHPRLAARLRPYTLRVVISQSGVIMLWPVPITKGGRDLPVWQSYRKAAEMAQTEWISMVWSDEHRDYIITSAEGEIPEPVWPERTLSEFLIEGFADAVIDNEEHPYVRKVRGLVD